MSRIEWTDETWNPVTGCSKVSAGCKSCYAEKMAKRLQAMGQIKYKDGFKVTLHPNELDRPLHWKKPKKIFICSMSDLFHEDVPDGFIDKIPHTIRRCPQHIFQILTKRPERMYKRLKHIRFIMSNLWLGVTAENQAMADKRIPLLLQTPATVRFVSAEPLLSHIQDMSYYLDGDNKLDWIIIGCESGPNRRPCKLEWVRSLVDQGQNAGVSVFVKQLDIDGKVVKDWDNPLFPDDLKIREFPLFGQQP